MKLVRIPLLLAVLSVVLLALSGLGVRAGWWPYAVGFTLLRWVVGVGAAAVLLAVISLLIPKARAAAVPTLLISAVIGAAAAWMPWQMAQQAKTLPRIHDISTDLADPPMFVAVLKLRVNAPNPATYGGPEVAAAQRSAYPDIQPLLLNAPVAEVFAAALAEAKKQDWQIAAQDGQTGRIEATATTFWFGFKDDIVVRITPIDGKSRVDVRSVSRVGKSDVGKNAQRIRDYLAALSRQSAK
jgi:hypothetical protein